MDERRGRSCWIWMRRMIRCTGSRKGGSSDRKSTRLNSSHVKNSYAAHRALHSFPTRRSSDLTLNRLELSLAERPTRYHKIGHEPEAIERLFVDLFLEAHGRAPRQIVLDLDATDDPLHGEQEGRFFRSEEHTSELQSREKLVCRPPSSTLFPYTTLFRSHAEPTGVVAGRAADALSQDWPRAGGDRTVVRGAVLGGAWTSAAADRAGSGCDG